jgi:hypothetical protein
MTNARQYATHRPLAIDKKKKNPVKRINFVFGKLGKRRSAWLWLESSRIVLLEMSRQQ